MSGSKLGKYAQRFLMFVGFGTVTAGIASALLLRRLSRKRLETLGLPPDGFILELDLEDVQLVEKQTTGLQSLLSRARHTLELQKAARAIRAAGDDERVLGLLGLVGGNVGAGLAQVQELRQAILSFRQKSEGRAACMAYADSFGEGGGGGTASYYLASAFEHVFLMPSGLLSFTGLAVEQPFARGLLDRLKIRPLVIQREEYKSALSSLVNSSFTAPERDATTSLLQDLSAQIVLDVASARGLTPQAVQAAVDGAPHSTPAALRLGLVDAGLYRDQAARVAARVGEWRRQRARAAAAAAAVAAPGGTGRGGTGGGEQQQQQPEGKQADAEGKAAVKAVLDTPDVEPGREVPRVPLSRYVLALEAQRVVQPRPQHKQAYMELRKALSEDGAADAEQEEEMKQMLRRENKQVPVVAVLTLSGNILLGRGERSPGSMGDANEIASLPVVKFLQAVAAHPAIKAVVLRIDSPGGSAIASDAIHREVARLRAVGKSVVVSMGSVAASGGYFIAAGANKIVAQPATLTGSIGVISGKVVLGEFLKESLSINTETIATGKNAAALSIFDAYTKEQEEQANRMVDEVYATFLRRVAEGRGMEVEAVRALAKGRVWTGQQALARGLVDALGGLEDAVQLAKQEAGLPLEEGAVLVQEVYPLPRPGWSKLVDLLTWKDSMQVAGLGGALAAALSALGLGGQQQVGMGPALQAAAAATLQGSQHLQGSVGLPGHALAPQMYSVQAQQVLTGLSC